MKEIKISVEKNYNLLPVGDPEKSNGTTEKMVELLNVDLKQMVSLEEGLIETIKFINNNSWSIKIKYMLEDNIVADVLSELKR